MEQQTQDRFRGRNGSVSLPSGRYHRSRRESATPDVKRYLARPARPIAQLAVWAGLLMFISLGWLSGVIALSRSGSTEAVVQDADADSAHNARVVPASVAGIAEWTVREWLTSSGESGDFDQLFVEDVEIAGTANIGDELSLEVVQVTTIAGERLLDGYWSVTVMTELTGVGAEVSTDDDESELAPVEEEQAPLTTWFVEVGIVDDGEGRLSALTAPAVIPAPFLPAETLRVKGEATSDLDSPLASTVEAFLNALLAGNGDPSPYTALDVELNTPTDPYFAELTIQRMFTQDLGDGRTWVLVEVLGSTETGVSLPLSYDLTMGVRGDRWEVVALSGVPTVVE